MGGQTLVKAVTTKRDTTAVNACQKLIQSGTSKIAYNSISFCEIIEVRDSET